MDSRWTLPLQALSRDRNDRIKSTFLFSANAYKFFSMPIYTAIIASTSTKDSFGKAETCMVVRAG